MIAPTAFGSADCTSRPSRSRSPGPRRPRSRRATSTGVWVSTNVELPDHRYPSGHPASGGDITATLATETYPTSRHATPAPTFIADAGIEPACTANATIYVCVQHWQARYDSANRQVRSPLEAPTLVGSSRHRSRSTSRWPPGDIGPLRQLGRRHRQHRVAAASYNVHRGGRPDRTLAAHDRELHRHLQRPPGHRPRQRRHLRRDRHLGVVGRATSRLPSAPRFLGRPSRSTASGSSTRPPAAGRAGRLRGGPAGLRCRCWGSPWRCAGCGGGHEAPHRLASLALALVALATPALAPRSGGRRPAPSSSRCSQYRPVHRLRAVRRGRRRSDADPMGRQLRQLAPLDASSSTAARR